MKKYLTGILFFDISERACHHDPENDFQSSKGKVVSLGKLKLI